MRTLVITCDYCSGELDPAAVPIVQVGRGDMLIAPARTNLCRDCRLTLLEGIAAFFIDDALQLRALLDTED